MASIKAERRHISPEEAEKLLKKNNFNRPVRDEVVSRYAEEMKEGRWEETGESIIIDDKEELADGQHRLLAVVESGEGQDFLVVEGVDGDARFTIDTGEPRRAKDVLKMQGFKYASNLASSCKILWFELGPGLAEFTNPDVRPTNRDILDLAMEHAEEFYEAIRFNNTQENSTQLLTPSIAGWFVFATRRRDESLSNWFMDKLDTGAGLDQNSPVLKLRDFLNVHQRRPQGRNRGTILARTVDAWNEMADMDDIFAL